jgi:Tfp pilus assembly protein PilN
MRAVNLLPVDRRSAKTAAPGLDSGRKNILIASGAVGALVVVGLSVMVWSSNSTIGDKRKQLEALRSQIASTSGDANSSALRATRKATVLSLVSGRLQWDQLLGTLSKVTPEDVWLHNLQSTVAGAAATRAAQQAAAAAASASVTAQKTTTSSSSATASTPVPRPAVPTSTFTVTGFTYSQPSVARMMRRLSIVPWLSGVTLVSSSKTQIGSATLFEFTVKATVNSTPAVP